MATNPPPRNTRHRGDDNQGTEPGGTYKAGKQANRAERREQARERTSLANMAEAHHRDTRGYAMRISSEEDKGRGID